MPLPCGPRSRQRQSGVGQPLRAMRRRALLNALASTGCRRCSAVPLCGCGRSAQTRTDHPSIACGSAVDRPILTKDTPLLFATTARSRGWTAVSGSRIRYRCRRPSRTASSTEHRLRMASAAADVARRRRPRFLSETLPAVEVCPGRHAPRRLGNPVASECLRDTFKRKNG